MTGKLSRILLIASLSLGAFALAEAQTPPPAGGGDKPAGGDAKPAGEKPADKPPEKFHSPFNGDLEPDSTEAQDFAKLLDLYDAMLDAQAALTAAEKCNGDTKKAKEALDKATAAFNEAFDEYVIGWDTSSGSLTLNWYHSKVKDHSKPYMKGGKAQKTLEALAKADKKKHDAAACPPKGTPQTPPAKTLPGDTAPEHTGLPPCDDGDKVAARIEDDETELADVMEKERAAGGDALASLKTEEAGLRAELAGLNDLKACPSDYHPPTDEGGGGGAVTIGIGVGVGDDHHHHDDRDKNRDDRDKPRGDYNH